MCCDELVKLNCKAILFNDEGMVVKICSSKDRPVEGGASLVIAYLGASTCPVDMMQRYCSMAKIDLTSGAKLFRGIVSVKDGELFGLRELCLAQ